ncbi:glycosyltransferase [Algoriphagus hitonicola]|uniref:Glycosyltransferase involved in cell wall bisynthesis n=1 Tax=Algoriphagus hitonicola TaxID=435880 RepID=A0A1I2XVA9_9BACT|nr:glycosyltransferase [Algoriphagus hitonicola]SFH16051.1 Glycosyltransferase involved in cell wall bisynthesis [Algoriphagus hitonicola]
MAGNPWGGSEELWNKLALDALQDNHDVECSVFDWGETPIQIKNLNKIGVVIKKRSRFIYPNLFKKPFGKLKEYLIADNQLSDHLNNKDYAIVSMGGFCDLAVKAFRNPLLNTTTPYSLIIHANPEDTYFNYGVLPEMIEVCKKAYKVYFVSERLKSIAIRQTGYTFPNGELIINPLNMESVGVLPYVDDETLQLACVGRLNAKVKGQAILLQCLANKKWQNRNWHLNIYGKGNDLSYFQHLAKSFNIIERVSFHGHVNDIRQDIWSKNHILIMPSYYEGMPIALAEAMLCGRTAVATDVGGNAELIKDNVTGFIAKAANYSAFDDALERAWSEKENWERMGIRAFEDADSYFNYSNYCKNINDVLPQ